ncbi:MAG TPA: peptidoglycan bridge formation glycyltransferase FemA/FemB family protein [Elusimicrobiota bacterium]|nr:peptidoglycan bridge formation glycyltransferase FemA/FemB family protein [Elusimicrobiota bacterium]
MNQPKEEPKEGASAAGSAVFIKEAAAWDRFVSGSEKPHIMQSWAWAELKAKSGWRPHRLLIERRGGARVGVSVLERDFPKIGRRFFYAPRGPVVATGWRPEDLEQLFLELAGLAKNRRAVFLKMDPDVSLEQDWISSDLRGAGFVPATGGGGFAGVQPRCVFRLKIGASEEELLKNMDQKTRYNIRLAGKKGVTVRPVSDRAEIETFHRILIETGQRDGFMVRPLRYFNDIQDLMGPRGQAQYFLAELGGKALAGALALRFGPVCWYAYGASSNEGRQHMPNHLMQWTMIRWAKSQGCGLYDFRAVPDDPNPQNPLYGLYRFKKGFGGDLVRFVGEFDKVYSPWWYRMWAYGWPVYKSVRKFMRGPARKAGRNE